MPSTTRLTQLARGTPSRPYGALGLDLSGGGDTPAAMVYEIRQAPLRAANRYYYQRSDDVLFFELQDLADLPYQPIKYAEWRAPLRAAGLYYRHQLDEIPGGDDASDGGFIVAYQESWLASPARLRYNWTTAQDLSIVPDIAVDPSRIVGRYRAGRHLVARQLFYLGIAQDITVTAGDIADVPYQPIRYADWRGPVRAAKNFYWGDYGQDSAPAVDEACAPRDRGPGVATAAGLARAVDGTSCGDDRHVHDETCGGR